jgi:hypothetical protein
MTNLDCNICQRRRKYIHGSVDQIIRVDIDVGKVLDDAELCELSRYIFELFGNGISPLEFVISNLRISFRRKALLTDHNER